MPSVLVATMDANAQAILAAELEGEGYTVAWATDGQEAIELALSQQPLLILLDPALPVFNGMETAMMLRTEPELADWTSIYLLTNEDIDPHTIDKCRANGVFAKTHQHHQVRELLAEVLQLVPAQFLT